jgi:tetratricopeptide (TPR) repeat protein/photosystem II stability/assembly factor-like uncharacterized protein
LETILNPYIAGAPVADSKMFFGREDIFEWIEKNLAGESSDHILVVHGQRRVGKTSVLKQLGNRLPKNYVPIFFDLQGRTHTTLDRFLWWLAREIARTLNQERGIEIALTEKESFSSDPDYFENHFIPELLPRLQGSTLLLTFDEFDNLEEDEIKDSLARPLIDYLRRVMGTTGLSFIYSIGSSGRKLENMQASYTEFFKTALYRKISFLSQDEATKLITQPVKGSLEFERNAVESIYQITFGHPYFTQLVCHELFALAQRTGGTKIRSSDVDSVLDDVVERGTVNLKFVWDEASDLEKWTLAGLAHLEGKTDFRGLSDFLRKQRVRFADPDLNSALLHLREKDVLNQENHFVIRLLKIWLVKNRPLEQVRDELTEVNPIANRYIEIGMEYKDTQQYDKAIENFKEALEVDHNNIQAQTNIGLVYLDQKSFDKAIGEFEKSLILDDEDVAARSGLCYAHLALGDLAFKKGRSREAIQSYQRVLAINAEHTEARQRMAEIHRQRAEAALIAGNDEEALGAFTEALKYTPEDRNLVERVSKVREEKRAKVIKSLSGKAEKEIAAQNWEQAIHFYEEALTLSPDNPKIIGQIAEMHEKQKKVHLEALRSKADQAMQSSKWDEATIILNEYLSQEPGDKAVQKKLGYAQDRVRQSRLEALHTKAKSLSRAEKWEDAIAAWKQYLEMDPDDKKDAVKEMDEVEKARVTATAYSEAQKALTKKNYSGAIELLKGIVVENENYKDASSMLAQAIELRRTAPKWWQHKWLWGITGGVAFVGLAFLVIRLFMLTPAAPSPSTQIPVIISTQGPSPVPTNLPTPTATAVPLAWSRVNSFKSFTRDTISAFVVDPADPGVMYAGTQNAGLYKSIDGGMTWSPSGQGLNRGWINSLVIDPTDHNIVYAGVSLGGAFKSTDGGTSWQALPPLDQSGGWEHVSNIVMDPSDHNHLYYTQSDRLYSSTDGGQTWDKLNFGSCPQSIVTFAVNPKDGKTLYAGVGYQDTCEKGLYVSKDSGNTWEITSLKEDISFDALGIDSQNGDHIYVSSQDSTFVSVDGGSSWKKTDIGSCYRIMVDPNHPEIAFCSSGGKLLKTTDSGNSWFSLGKPITLDGTNVILAFLSYQENKLFAAAQGVYISTDAGTSWVLHSNGLGATRFDLTPDPSHVGTIFAEIPDYGIYQSKDSGTTWTSFVAPGSNLAVDSYTNSLLVLRDNLLYISQDGGNQWTPKSSPANMSSPLASVGVNPYLSYIYALYNRNNPPYIFYSKDNGTTWQSTTGMQDIYNARIFVGPKDPNLVYAIGDNGFSFSQDGGFSWSNCQFNSLWAAKSNSRLIVDPQNSEVVFLATRGGGVLKSDSHCSSWLEKNSGLGNLNVNTLAFDPNHPATLYAGTDNGIYISYDDGEHWGEISNGLLGVTVVYSIFVDAQGNVFSGTPYGIFQMVNQ